MDPLNGIDDELRGALNEHPSPEFVVRVRTEIARQTTSGPRDLPRLLLGASALAALAVIAIVTIPMSTERHTNRDEPGSKASTDVVDQMRTMTAWRPLPEAVVATLPLPASASSAAAGDTRRPREPRSSAEPPGQTGQVVVAASEMKALQRLFRGEYRVALQAVEQNVNDRLLIPEIAIEPIAFTAISSGEHR
jgi:hypothetical protein